MEDKQGLWIVAIVAIVAVVALVILIMGGSGSSTTEDASGQAMAVTCEECQNGCIRTMKDGSQSELDRCEAVCINYCLG